MKGNGTITDAVGGGAVTVLGSIYHQCVEQSMPWLVSMTLIVLVDLLTGLRKCWMMDDEIRWSKGFRATISKLVCYWSFAICACMVQVSCDNEYAIAKWACLVVIAIEGISIIGNVLKPHGVNINAIRLLKNLGKKADLDLEGVVTEDKEAEEKMRGVE